MEETGKNTAPVLSPRIAIRRRGKAARSATARWRWPAVLAVVLAVGLATLATLRLIAAASPAVDLPLAGRLALLPFSSPGTDRAGAWVENGLMEMVAEAVAKTAGSAVVSPERLRRAFEPRQLDLRDPAARERARRLALVAGATQVLDATFDERSGGWVIDVALYDAGGRVGAGEVKGAGPLEAADALAFALARGLTSDAEPRHLAQSFSRSPFVDRLYATGLEALRSSGPEAARRYFEIALDHRPGFFQARARLADCVRLQGEIEPARALAEELLREAQSRGDRSLEAGSLRTLALIAALAGELDSASGLYSQAFDIYLELADRPAQSEVIYELARLALARGDRGRAEELYVELLRIQQSLADRLGEADTLFQIGSLLLAGGDLAGAERVLSDARELALQTGDVWIEMGVAASLGEVAHRRDQSEVAEDFWRRALAFYEQRGEHPRRLLLTYKLAVSLVKSEKFDEAEDLLQDMRELAVEIGDESYEAKAALGLAWLLLRTGYPYQAKTHLDRALELDRWLEDRVRLQQVIAWYAYEQGNYRLAVDTQLGVKRQSENRWRPVDQAFLDVFEQAQREGRRLPLPGEDGYRPPG